MAGSSWLPELCVDPPLGVRAALGILHEAAARCDGAGGGEKLLKGLRSEPEAAGRCASLPPVPGCPRATSEAGAAVCPSVPPWGGGVRVRGSGRSCCFWSPRAELLRVGRLQRFVLAPLPHPGVETWQLSSFKGKRCKLTSLLKLKQHRGGRGRQQGVLGQRPSQQQVAGDVSLPGEHVGCRGRPQARAVAFTRGPQAPACPGAASGGTNGNLRKRGRRSARCTERSSGFGSAETSVPVPPARPHPARPHPAHPSPSLPPVPIPPVAEGSEQPQLGAAAGPSCSAARQLAGVCGREQRPACCWAAAGLPRQQLTLVFPLGLSQPPAEEGQTPK